MLLGALKALVAPGASPADDLSEKGSVGGPFDEGGVELSPPPKLNLLPAGKVGVKPPLVGRVNALDVFAAGGVLLKNPPGGGAGILNTGGGLEGGAGGGVDTVELFPAASCFA